MHLWRYCWIQIVYFASIFVLLVACFKLTDSWFTPWWVSSLIFLSSLIALTTILSYWLWTYGDFQEEGNHDGEKEYLIVQLPAQHLLSSSSLQSKIGASNPEIQSF